MALWEDLVNEVEQRYNGAKQSFADNSPANLGADQQVYSQPVIPQQTQPAQQSDNPSPYQLPAAGDLVNSVISMIQPSPETASSLQSTAQGIGNAIIPSGLPMNAVNDIANKAGQWAQGIQPGLQEAQRAAQQYPDMSSAEMPGGAGLTPDEQQALEYNQRAVSNFTNETIKPVAYTAGLVNPLVAAPFLANDAMNLAQDKGIGEVAKEFSGYNAASRAIDNPTEFSNKIYNEPVSTAAEFLPAFITGRMVLKGGKALAGKATDYAKAGETVGRDMKTEQPIDPNTLLKNEADLTTTDPTTGVTRLKTPEEVQTETQLKPAESPVSPVVAPPIQGEQKPPHQDLVDAVEQKMNPSSNIVKNFGEQTLSPIAQGAVESARNLRDFISPASVNDFTRNTADTIRQYNAERKLSTLQAEKALKDAHEYFANKPIPEQLNDAIAYQSGKLNDPAVKPIVDVLHEQLNSRGQQLKDMGKLEDFEQDYLPQIWAQTPRNMEILSKYKAEVEAENAKGTVGTPNLFNTPSGFLKRKLVPDYDYGLNVLKLEPKYTNPVDMATFRIGQEDKFIMGEKIKSELTDSGDLQAIRPKPYVDAEGKARIAMAKPPDGWERVGKPGDPMWDTRQGVYYARPEVARVIENFIGKGWQDAKPYQAWMKTANTMNQFQLLGGFHIGFTSMDTMVSKATLIPKLAEDAVRNTMKGNFKQAGSNIADAVVKAAGVVPSPVTTAWKGSHLIKDLLDSKKQNDPIVRAWKAGGGKIGLPEEFTTQWLKSYQESYRGNNAIMTVAKIPFVLAEKLSGVITDKIVPWQKAGVFKELMGYELKKNPDLLNNQKQLRNVAGKVMDTIDNRLGQVNWDNLFFDPKFKQMLFVSMRAPGWTGGTIREIGGGLKDLAQTKQRLATGDSLITHRMAYNIALPLTSLIVNGALQTMLTGKQPDWTDEWKSLAFKYKNGTQGSLGETNYSTSPSYMKDIHAWFNDPIGTATNKTHPALSVMAQLYKNKDYFNTQITNPEDNALGKLADRAKYVAKQYLPFSVANGIKLNDQGTSPVQQGMTFFGLNPAPSDLTATDAQRKVRELMGKIEVTKTPEHADKSKMISQLRHDLASGKINQMDIYNVFKSGQIDEKQAKDIIKNKDTPGIARGVNHFSVDDVIKVYNVATPEEQAQMKDVLIKKLDTAFHSKETTPEQKQQYYELFKKIR